MTGGPSLSIQKSVYRIGQGAILCLAAIYVLMTFISAASYTGASLSALTFTLQSLRADAYDMVSVVSDRTLGFGLGAGAHPTRYALICQEVGPNGLPLASETENAANEARVRRQLTEFRSGTAYNQIRWNLAQGNRQPILILSSRFQGGADVCAARTYWTQTCDCSGKFHAVERSRIIARDLFGPEKPVN